MYRVYTRVRASSSQFFITCRRHSLHTLPIHSVPLCVCADRVYADYMHHLARFFSAHTHNNTHTHTYTNTHTHTLTGKSCCHRIVHDLFTHMYTSRSRSMTVCPYESRFCGVNKRAHELAMTVVTTRTRCARDAMFYTYFFFLYKYVVLFICYTGILYTPYDTVPMINGWTDLHG